jgi:hypothetical protein
LPEETNDANRLRQKAQVVTTFSAITLFIGLIKSGDPGLGGLGRFIHFTSVLELYLGAWGLLTGIGLYRRWRWARFSILLFSSLLAAVGTVLAGMLLIFWHGNHAGMPWWQALLVRGFLILIFLIPVVWGGYWLKFFTRKGIRAQFQASPPSSGSTSLSAPPNS